MEGMNEAAVRAQRQGGALKGQGRDNGGRDGDPRVVHLVGSRDSGDPTNPVEGQDQFETQHQEEVRVVQGDTRTGLDKVDSAHSGPPLTKNENEYAIQGAQILYVGVIARVWWRGLKLVRWGEKRKREVWAQVREGSARHKGNFDGDWEGK
jgi:hypothetical protein